MNAFRSSLSELGRLSTGKVIAIVAVSVVVCVVLALLIFRPRSASVQSAPEASEATTAPTESAVAQLAASPDGALIKPVITGDLREFAMQVSMAMCTWDTAAYTRDEVLENARGWANPDGGDRRYPLMRPWPEAIETEFERVADKTSFALDACGLPSAGSWWDYEKNGMYQTAVVTDIKIDADHLMWGSSQMREGSFTHVDDWNGKTYTWHPVTVTMEVTQRQRTPTNTVTGESGPHALETTRTVTVSRTINCDGPVDANEPMCRISEWDRSTPFE